eukprot:CAMPEP_0174895314 /NCGR_PEP_ID=MMETSP0167-20121228/9754_1 /TAXON_ID=38298 /ORGANISM="Rhodella maculata, Strain CCMP736" /LENGTH=75 /DNA_ID=CAMNT_0016134617 /DNA_START=49 /DNA_END=276 /DNA_ORIENTATION=+
MNPSSAISVPKSASFQKRSPQYAESGSIIAMRQRKAKIERARTLSYDKEKWMSEMNSLVASAFQQQEASLDFSYQ